MNIAGFGRWPRLMPTGLMLWCIALGTVPKLCAQSGMDFREFSTKLDLYFDKEMVADVAKQLPQGTEYNVWGWDVGDYSGDGNFDVAFTIRIANERRNSVHVYLFVDLDGFLTNVTTLDYEFVETPLEVGMVIKNNMCYVTRKTKQLEWRVSGYRFTQGSIVLIDDFISSRVDQYIREYYKNYQTLRHELKFLQHASNDETFHLQYVAIPCYRRGEQPVRTYTSRSVVNTIDFVTKGPFYWRSTDDCSFTVHSVYDDAFIYMTVSVTDDEVVTARCDTCPADYIDIWLDVSENDAKRDRVFKRKGKRLQFRSTSDSNIYRISVRLGDFKEQRPEVIVRATDVSDSELQQKVAVKQIAQKVALRSNGYEVKIRIPFSLLGYSAVPSNWREITELGCTVVVHDIDNEYRPEEETILASSQVEDMNPSTFGVLLIVPQDKTFGEAHNMFADGVVRYLNNLGY